MSDNIPTPSPDEVNRTLSEEKKKEDAEAEAAEEEPAEPNEEPEGRLSLSKTPSDTAPVVESEDSFLSVRTGAGLLFLGLGLSGIAGGIILDGFGVDWRLAAAATVGAVVAAAGLSGLFLAIESRLQRQHDEVMAAVADIDGFGLPGLDAEQARQLERQQALIDEVLDDLPEQQARLEALDESIPTQGEQLRLVAESQREIWEEIEEEFR